MADDAEERRKQDLRDLEFYSQRVRPTVSDLLRTNELSWKNNKILMRSEKLRERGQRVQGLQIPSSLAEIYADSRYGAEQPDSEDSRPVVPTARIEIVRFLAAAGVFAVLVGWAGSIDRAVKAFVF